MSNRLIISLLLYLLFMPLSYGQSNNVNLDSILSLRSSSRDKSLDLNERIRLAKLASNLSEKFFHDSTLLRSNRNLSLLFFENQDVEFYVELNRRNYSLAERLKDTSSLAVSSLNLGSHFGFTTPINNDSAFYYYDRALLFFDHLSDSKLKATIFLYIANLQKDQKDYLAAEESLIKALSLFDKLKKSEEILYYQHVCYDMLAEITRFTLNLDSSIEYHDKGIEILQKMENNAEYLLGSMNNKAFTLRKLEKYDESLNLYNEVLASPSFFKNDPGFYALVLDNIAFTKFVRGDKTFDEIERDLRRAYQISDSINDNEVKLGVAIDLSKVLEAQNKLEASKIYAKESLDLAKEQENNEIYLDALLILSKTSIGEEAKAYLYKHINLSDSLLGLERSARNKFARIKFDTDQIEKENKIINRQKQWLIGIVSGLLLITFLVYIIISQRAKNKELQFVQDQQKANEEIYNLMLSQQDKVDEAKVNEKKRISQEIHDGVLGRMFGVRLSLDSLNLSTGQEAVNNRASYINELKGIEEDMRKISHELNTDFVSGSGFVDILDDLIKKQTTAFGLEHSFDQNDDINWELVSNKTKINLYRIIQETLQNIYKHAKANKVWISLLLKHQFIYLGVRDDGKGYDLSKEKKGIGLKNINSRVDEIQGKVKFESIINEGTSVEIEVPYST